MDSSPGLGLGSEPGLTGAVAPPRRGDPWNPGPSALRRLSQFEYVNTVKALLLGDDAGVGNIVPVDEPPGGFDSNADLLPVTDLHVEKYLIASEAVARAALAKLERIAPCASAGEGCARTLLEGFGKRVFRRPVTADEATRLLGVYRAGASGASHPEGLRWMLKTMLQSPAFLYHVELGVPIAGEPRLLRLSHHEIGARLSYFLLGGPPDDGLMAAADGGLLGTTDQVARQARRLLAHPQAFQGIGHFLDQLLETDRVLGDDGLKLATVYKGFDGLRADLSTEMSTFAGRTFFEDGKLETLLAAPHSYLNAKLAAFYGVPAPAPTGLARVELDPAQRAGFLTQGAFLAAHAHPDQTSPVLRGKFIRERLLCGAPLTPPPNVNVNPPPFDPRKSARQQISEVTGVAGCRECHGLINELGFPLESLDTVGRWRTMDGGSPVDATGWSIEFPEIGKVDGPVQLARRLAQSARARTCFVQQLYQYAVARTTEELDQDTLAWLAQRLEETRYDMRELAVAVAVTPAFQFKLREGGGR